MMQSLAEPTAELLRHYGWPEAAHAALRRWVRSGSVGSSVALVQAVMKTGRLAGVSQAAAAMRRKMPGA